MTAQFIDLTPDYDVLRDYGLRIVRDESYSITRNPKHIDLRDVSGILAGITIALDSVPITPETLPIRDFIVEMLDTKFKPAISKLNEEEWGMEDSEDDY